MYKIVKGKLLLLLLQALQQGISSLRTAMCSSKSSSSTHPSQLTTSPAQPAHWPHCR